MLQRPEKRILESLLMKTDAASIGAPCTTQVKWWIIHEGVLALHHEMHIYDAEKI
jgi:hypothetical protein